MLCEPKLLSVIVPAYKQQNTIAHDIKDLDAALVQLGIPYEIIVVVDGNVDKTLTEAEKVGHNRRRVIVTGYEHNKGKGYAVRFGMARSKGEIISFIDAGSDISPDGISMLLSHFRWYNADIIVGSKRHPVSKVYYPLARRILSFGYQVIIKILFGINIRDTQSGLKLYRREVLTDVLPRLLVKQFAFDIEILAVANHLGYKRIFEAPLELDFSGASSITSANFWSIALATLWDTLAVFYRLHILHYYDAVNKRKWRDDPELNFKINLG